MAHAQQSFLLAKIDFDVPALEIGLDEEPRVELFIGTDQKGGLAIEELGAAAQPVSEGCDDDDQLQNLVGAGGASHQTGTALEGESMLDAVAGEGEGLPRRIIGADLLGSGGRGAVAEAAAARLVSLGIG